MSEQRPNTTDVKKNEKTKKWLWWGLAALLVLGFVFLLVLSYRQMTVSNYNTAVVKFWEICCQAYIGASGILFLYFQIREMARNTKKMTRNTKAVHEWNKRHRTLEAISRLDFYEDFKAVKKYCTGNGGTQNNASLEKLPKKIDASLSEHVDKIINFFEITATGIKHGVYDENMFYDSMQGVYIKYYDCFCDYMAEEREGRNNSRTWIDFERLAKKWKEKNREEAEKIGDVLPKDSIDFEDS